MIEELRAHILVELEGEIGWRGFECWQVLQVHHTAARCTFSWPMNVAEVVVGDQEVGDVADDRGEKTSSAMMVREK